MRCHRPYVPFLPPPSPLGGEYLTFVLFFPECLSRRACVRQGAGHRKGGVREHGRRHDRVQVQDPLTVRQSQGQGQPRPSREHRRGQSVAREVQQDDEPGAFIIFSPQFSPVLMYVVQEMASEERKAADKKIQEENFFKSLSAAEKQAETDAFQCSRCKQVRWICVLVLFRVFSVLTYPFQRKCVYRQQQTRSADEPMTVRLFHC